jgi:hypothetical protein
MPIDRDGDGPPLRRTESKVSLTPGENRGADLRATPFTDDVFNDDDYGRRSPRAAGGVSISVIAGVALGLVVAVGAGWYLLRGSGVTFTPNAVGFIKADPTPYKVKPDDPGGMQVDNQDKLVYDRVAKGQAPARVENLLPPAEEPKAPPPKPQEPAKVEALPAAEAPTEAAKPETPAADVAKVEPPKPEPAPAPAPEAKPTAPQADPLAAAVAAATAGRESATGPIAVTPQAAVPSGEPAAALATPEAETQVAAVPGAFQVQLASVLSEQAAMAEWGRISGKNKDLLGALKPAVTKADLGDRGVFYRLRAGPLADKAAADALCASLSSANVGCMVVRP